MTVRTEPIRRAAMAARARSVLFVALPLALFLLSFLVGRYPVDPLTVVKVLAARLLSLDHTWPEVVDTVVLDVRLPRLLGALVIGGSLSLSGAVYQGVFRNPLVSEFTLGVSAGAGFGAAGAILLFHDRLLVQGAAFLFALAAVGLCFGMGRLYRAASPLVLVLAGIIVASVFTSLLALLKYTADPNSQLPVIEYWLLGSLSSLSMADVVTVTGICVPAIVILLAFRWRLNLLAMGDRQARSLGVEPGRLRLGLILCATLIAASAVSVSGIIGWVGLVIPHFARMLVGPDFRRVLPASLSLGACYLIAIDDLARVLTAAEIPLGILTALVGAPVFAALLRRNKLGWA